MKCWISIILVVSILATAVAVDDVKYKVTNTNYGPVKGMKLLSKYDGKEFYSYRGIPYAKPPVGELRYRVWRHKLIVSIENTIRVSPTATGCPRCVEGASGSFTIWQFLFSYRTNRRKALCR